MTARDSEIRWCLKVVESHYSYNSCEKIKYLFQKMFPDSAVALEFRMGASKCSYTINYGIGPVAREGVLKMANEAPFHTLMYDESLNQIDQNCQMDIHVRFWNEVKGVANSRYLISKFLKNANAANLLEC